MNMVCMADRKKIYKMLDEGGGSTLHKFWYLLYKFLKDAYTYIF